MTTTTTTTTTTTSERRHNPHFFFRSTHKDAVLARKRRATDEGRLAANAKRRAWIAAGRPGDPGNKVLGITGPPHYVVNPDGSSASLDDWRRAASRFLFA